MKTSLKIFALTLSIAAVTACGKKDSDKTAGVTAGVSAVCSNTVQPAAYWQNYRSYGLRAYVGYYSSYTTGYGGTAAPQYNYSTNYYPQQNYYPQAYPQQTYPQPYPNAYPQNVIGNQAYQCNSLSQLYNQQAQGFCGCPSGYAPAYNGAVGMSCVRTSYIGTQAAIWSYNYGQQQMYFARYGGMRPMMTGTFGSNACYSGFAQLCTVGQVDACSTSGGICVATTVNSLYGVCRR
jgi:hypothetical protein